VTLANKGRRKRCMVALSLCLPLAAFGQPPKMTSAVRHEAIEPGAKAVINRYVQACGGAAAMAKIVSQHCLFRVEMLEGRIVGKLEAFIKDPGKILMRTYFPGVGESQQGFDGKVAWSIEPKAGPKLLQGKMLEELRERALGHELYSKFQFKTMQLLGRAQFAGTECTKLRLVKHSGAETTEYFAISSGLLVGYSEVVTSSLGAVRTTVQASDYKSFDGVLMPTKCLLMTSLFDQLITLEKVESNKVDDSIFELPKPIQALASPGSLAISIQQ
jgi:zinc protease